LIHIRVTNNRTLCRARSFQQIGVLRSIGELPQKTQKAQEDFLWILVFFVAIFQSAWLRFCRARLSVKSVVVFLMIKTRPSNLMFREDNKNSGADTVVSAEADLA